MEKARTNSEAFGLIIGILGTKTALAQHLGLSKQLVSRWNEIPPRYLGKVCETTQLPIESVLPELETAVSALLGRPSALLLPELIRLVTNDKKASPWPDRKRPKSQPKPRKKRKKK